MKSKDLLILANLRKNARMSLTNMSKKTSVPISTIYDRLKIFNKDFVKKHTTLVDFSKLGYHTRANIALKVKKDDRDSIKEYLLKHQNVNSLYKINSGYDYLIEGVFVHIKDLDEFLENLDSKFTIEEKQTYYIVNDIKKEEFMSNPELIRQGIVGGK